MTIGSTTANCGSYILDDDDPVSSLDGSSVANDHGDHPVDTNNTDHNNPLSVIGDNKVLDYLFVKSLQDDFNLDDIMASAVHAARHQDVKPEHLSKVWRIDVNTARKALDITSKRSVRKDYPKLSRNYGTNDRMLRYKHLNE